MNVTSRFWIAFAALLAAYAAEFLFVHVRLAPEPLASLRRVEIDLDLQPERGRAGVEAVLDLEVPAGAAPRALSLALPAAAVRPRAEDAQGRPLRARLRPHGPLYVTSWPAPGGREWRLQRYAEPRLDIRLRGADGPLRVRLLYELEAERLRGAASLRPARTLLMGGWVPRVEGPYPQRPPAFEFRLRARAAPGERLIASGRLIRRSEEGGREVSEWSSLREAPEIWVVAGAFDDGGDAAPGEVARVYLPPGTEVDLRRQLAEDAARAVRALSAWAGGAAPSGWSLVAIDSLGAINRGLPPLLLLDSGVFRRAARRDGTRAERGIWIAREMARAWLAAPAPAGDARAAGVFEDALGAVLAGIAMGGSEPAPPGPHARIEWMMRCRAYAGEEAGRAPLGADGRPASFLLGACKLPAALDTLASQMGDERFVAMLTRPGPEPVLERLRAEGEGWSRFLLDPWLPDLSVEGVESGAAGTRVTVADRGRKRLPLEVEVLLEQADGGSVRGRARLDGSGRAVVLFPGVRAWRRAVVDPDRRVFQIEIGNDVLPPAANPWARTQALWDLRRGISRGEFESVVRDGGPLAEAAGTGGAAAGRGAAAGAGEAAYWVGFALLRLGRGSEAVGWLERAAQAPLDSDVVAAETLYLLAQACEASGDRERARRLYARVVEEGWTLSSAERARRALAALAEAPPG
jgi:hypothetical protein